MSFLCLVGVFIAGFIYRLILPLIFDTQGIWLTYVICAGGFAICLLLIWKPFSAKVRRIVLYALICSIALPVLTVAVDRVYKNSIMEVGDGEREIYLGYYEPFRERSRANALNEQSTLTITDDLPRLDGATALYPLYAAFVRATYPAANYNVYADPRADLEQKSGGIEYLSTVVCSKTDTAFENLIDGYADIIFLMGVSDAQRATAAAHGLELEITPIGREAFVFLVNRRNTVSNVSVEDIKAIYSGEITNWSYFGGENDAIMAYQRPENSGSQTMMQKLMDDSPLMVAPQEDIHSMMGLYTAVSSYKNYRNSLGYSFRYYIETMLNDAELRKVKLLEIDGIAPTAETIADGSYPFADNFYAITVANREPSSDSEKARVENTQRLIDWILSAQGQELVEKTGYVKIAGE
jgi:phosphate transport system substrate-binding protein